MNIKKPNSFARYGNDYVAPLTTIDQIVKPSGERYTDKEFELMSNVENVMFGENCAGKNLLNPTLQTTTINGVTCTNNGDGTYTLNGTAGADIIFTLLRDEASNNIQLGKTYHVTGCPNGGSLTTYYLRVSDVISVGINDMGNGGNIVFKNKKIHVTICVKSGTTLSNLVFKPMLTTDLSATYDDFEPYVKSLKQLTNSGLQIDLLWTNTTTTLSEQTISLNMSYKFYLVYINGSADGVTCNGVCPIINVANLQQYVFSAIVGTGVGVQSRSCMPTSSGLTFGAGYSARKAESGSSGNGYAVPIRIYGVK